MHDISILLLVLSVSLDKAESARLRLFVGRGRCRLLFRLAPIQYPERYHDTITQNQQDRCYDKRHAPVPWRLAQGHVTQNDDEQSKSEYLIISLCERKCHRRHFPLCCNLRGYSGHILLLYNESNKKPSVGGYAGLDRFVTTVRGVTVAWVENKFTSFPVNVKTSALLRQGTHACNQSSINQLENTMRPLRKVEIVGCNDK